MALLSWICRLALRVFFRHIDVAGREHLPEGGKLMFALNHPNGLLDPLFILCFAGRPVSFLAKEPLFRMPVVRYFVRAFGCLPVYRKQDAADPQKNREMMQRAVELLASGHALALFPEGTSHSDPRLRRLRSGAARIALCASALSDDVVRVIPVGLYYSRKSVFRSNALLLYGQPITVAPSALDEGFEPRPEPVHELTERLSTAIGSLTLQAESDDVLYLAKTAERIISAAERDDARPRTRNMAERLIDRQRLVAAHAALSHRPEVSALVERIRRHEAGLEALGLRVDQKLDGSRVRALAPLLGSLVAVSVLALPAVAGFFTHYATYRLVGWLAFRHAGGETDVIATGKVLGGLLLFPLTWALVGVGAGVWLGGVAGSVAALAAPLAGYAALRFAEIAAALLRRGRVLSLALRRDGFASRIAAERRAIRQEALRLGELFAETTGTDESSGAASDA